ncbi:CFEM domain-containing protein [Aspergillus foveolatus]|uniref:CFEM domain-containing protein n=1 Tax=Aspergillus foveolatus TaxID=210207 RepID=UPI003CCD6676
MKSHLLALILAVCLSSVIAQSLPGLPDCAQGCANGAIPSKCSPVDVECICATRSFIDDMACCVGKSCNADDQKKLTSIVSQAALDFANGICGGAGISDLPQSATCASDATSTTATASATVTATVTPTSDGKTTTTTAVTSNTESDQTSTEAASSTSADTSTQTSTSTETETPASSEDTDGATPLRGKSVGVLAGIAAGVAFVL